jgi:hypothetical protein
VSEPRSPPRSAVRSAGGTGIGRCREASRGVHRRLDLLPRSHEPLQYRLPELEISLILLLGVRAEDKKQIKVNPADLTACTEVGEKVALSRRVEKHWRLVGCVDPSPPPVVCMCASIADPRLTGLGCRQLGTVLELDRCGWCVVSNVYVEQRHSLLITHPSYTIDLHLLKESCSPTATRTNDGHPG